MSSVSFCIWLKVKTLSLKPQGLMLWYKNTIVCISLPAWQVLYNAAVVHVKMGNWDKARDILEAAGEEKGGARGGTVEAGLDSISVSFCANCGTGHTTSKSTEWIQNCLNWLFLCIKCQTRSSLMSPVSNQGVYKAEHVTPTDHNVKKKAQCGRILGI